ncbi:T9SS C-terminal target domain-containing protein [Pararhodonellum marinum]|uniref:T9SS C-terminal target domain-containing protein n=1 Tax=Pararhodonellum marinum TaxID=2755358 RepID=UPI00188F5672|nr:T9SS C-terminal target domain-containing protein [Pararhodonellum marinum]
MLICSTQAYGQNLGDYRSIANGNFNNPGIWEVYDGTNWQSAILKPDRNHDAYIENPHRVTLTGNEELRSLYLNRDVDAGEKINLNGFELHLYGSLNGYTGNTNPPSSVAAAGAFNPNNWIGNSVDSRIIFRGASRTIIRAGWWSALSTNSRYTVIFDPDPGAELTIERPFKANRFIIRSGKVIQKVFGEDECASFSFNTNTTVFGLGPYGELIVEPNATLETECSSGITFRSASGNVPSALFDLQEGGNLILLGNNPQINASDIRYEGAVYYSAQSGNQQFISATMPSAMIQNTYRHIYFENNAIKILPNTLDLLGNLTFLGGGNVVDNFTTLRFLGNNNQWVSGLELDLTEIEVNKPGGILFLEQNLRVKTNFSMINGTVDFMDNSLFLNTELSGTYQFLGGSWRNLLELHYHGLPANLTATNASFPFEDRYEEGIRMFQLLGNHSSAGNLLRIRYHQLPNVDWDPNFDDNDGSPILYKLNSHFEFEGNLSGTENLELRISADELIVVDVLDLRVVGEGIPAAGNHFPGLDQGVLWARRTVNFDQLMGTSATVGSTGIFSILPLTWLDFEAKQEEGYIQISWKTAQEKNKEKFILRKSEDGIDNFKVLAEIPSYGPSEKPQSYVYQDLSPIIYAQTYYQLEYIDDHGEGDSSHIIRARIHSPSSNLEKFMLYPNPYLGGDIKIQAPKTYLISTSKLLVYSFGGTSISEIHLGNSGWEEKLKELPKGKYLVILKDRSQQIPFIWIKK